MSLVYILKAVTNLHVGSGEGNYSIVDKQVERDEVSGYPAIYSSSLKGALREHFERKGLPSVMDIFGSEKDGSKPGSVKFLEGKLLARPMRASKGEQSSYLVTTQELLENFVRFLLISGKLTDSNLLAEIKKLPTTISLLQKPNQKIAVEGIDVNSHYFLSAEAENLLRQVFGEKTTVVLLSVGDFHKIQLPIRARNNLGENKNLWYEEHVPYDSIFYSLMMDNSFNGDRKALDDLEVGLGSENLVQVGANASVGFGLMTFEKWG